MLDLVAGIALTACGVSLWLLWVMTGGDTGQVSGVAGSFFVVMGIYGLACELKKRRASRLS